MIDATLVQRFAELFKGSAQAHGLWHPNQVAETVKGSPTEERWRAHLAGGGDGLGIVAAREDGTCRFGAIDVDVTTVDHAKVAAEVTRRRLPLAVCRSKSGGAHLYAFAPEPGVGSGFLREKLKLWAALLGFPSAEIFPKQARTSKQNFGNWINLPYYGGDKSTRYALGPAGALTLAQFLDSVQPLDPTKVDAAVDETVAANVNEMPPCLRSLSATGVPEGCRNQALFNFGVFFRKSEAQGWQDKLAQFNQVSVKPPLSYREFQAIARSIGTTRYQYTCEQSPIRELCDRVTCLKLRFGVAHKPWEELDQYDGFRATHLRKVLTNPPRYIVEVNGHDLTVSFDEFMSFAKMRARTLADLDLMVRPMKQAKWDIEIKDLLKTKEDIEAPPDASPEGQMLEALVDFLALKDRAKDRADLLKGLPIEVGGKISFRIQDFVRFLQGRRVTAVGPTELFTILRAHGCTHAHVSVKGRKFFVWSVPADQIAAQTEAFDVATMPPDEETM